MINPICFVSYSWDNEAHKGWVRKLATELMNNGVNVRLDQWDAQPGIDLGHFMEENIRTANFVLLICTPKFAEKANNSAGGVGYEKAIITGELFNGSPVKSKFVPLLKDGDSSTSLPSYLRSRLYIDFRDIDSYSSSFEDLLRHIFNSPKYNRPPLGTPPDFSKEKVAPTKDKSYFTPHFTSGNISSYRNDERWDWAVFIKGSKSDLDEVEYVEYTLHETFPTPVRTVRERGVDSNMAFPLSTNGWGVFRIFIRIFLKDSRILTLTHDLEFN